jgi:hypothetical protein
MGIQNPFKPNTGNNSIVDALIGNAYEIVKYVGYYITEIRYVAANMEAIHRVSTRLGELTNLRIKEVTSPHTIVADDLNYNTLVFNSASACSLIWPAQSELAMEKGTLFNVRNKLAGTITYSRSAASITAGDTLEGAGTVLTGSAAQKVSTIYLEDVVDGVNTVVTIGAFSS